VSQSPGDLRLDCSDLDPVHSSHIGLLWKARAICRLNSTDLVLENIHDSLIRTLEALDLIDIFEVKLSRDLDAVSSESKQCAITEGVKHIGTFSADAPGVDKSLRKFADVLESWKLDEDIRFDLRTIFYEVATNIRCHSGLSPTDLAHYRVECDQGELRLVFEDSGKPFDPLSLPYEIDAESSARNRQTRGFGISLIRKLADDIRYTNKDDINVILLTKRYGEKR